jgi:DNA-binding NarL/FixJ family response regulator
VLLARFEDLVSHGLRALLSCDLNLAIVAHDVEHDDLEAALTRHRPQVALVNFGSLHAAVEVHHLSSGHPDTRLLVLANRPTAGECNQMLAFGATACLSKETQGRDILNAVHGAQRPRGPHAARGGGARAPARGSVQRPDRPGAARGRRDRAHPRTGGLPQGGRAQPA